MKTRKLTDYIYDGDRDTQERIFLLVISATYIILFITFIILLIAEGPLGTVLLLGAGLLLYIIFGIFVLRKKWITLASVVTVVVTNFIYIPLTFFYGGGIYGDAPIWFVYNALLISLLLSGKLRIVFYVLEIAVATGCYFVSYYYPEWIDQNTASAAHRDSFISLVLISTIITIVIGYEMEIYKRETRRNQMQKKEIEALNASQNRFFSSMSHEIRTPINTIIGLNEMILRENASEEINENAANIQAASKMLLHLINDILDMSKFESGQMHLTPVSYRTGDMLSDVVGMLWLRAREKGLEFHVNVSPDLPVELIGDEVRIKQILINVLNNAIKYTSAGSVTLSIQCENTLGDRTTVIYSVSDTGMGIRKENIPYLFTAFRRVDETQNRHIEGTGLGLAIVKQFVDLMGGKIAVNSVYTKGSTFIIEIPQQIADPEAIGDTDIENRHRLKQTAGYHQRFIAPEAKVLVVDDTSANLMVVEKLLRDTRVRVVTAGSGEEALQKTMEEHFHVIFMDHLMPKMDGIECMHRIRTQTGGFSRDARIVALTANAGGESMALYAQEGFDGYLVKPVTGDALEMELIRHLPSDIVTMTGSDDEIMEESLSWTNVHTNKAMVKITTESVADLPKSVLEQFNITAIPHMVSTESGIFRDGIEIEQKGLLHYMERNHTSEVSSIAPGPEIYEAFFARQLESAYNIVHISISGQLAHSGCGAALEAARSFGNVFAIDSGHLSSGQGLMAIEAARMAQEGMGAEEILRRLEKIQPKIHTSFIVDNLDYLARAHQVGKRVAKLTKAFLIRPVLTLRHGDMGMGRVYFGSRSHAWKRYIASCLVRQSSIDHRILFVTYVGLTQSDLKWIDQEIRKRAVFEHIYYQKASPAITSNCGPGTFGLLYIRGRRESGDLN